MKKDEYQKAVGGKIREARMEKKLSLEDVILRTDLTVNTLSLIERGKQMPTLWQAQQVCNALDLSIFAFQEIVIERESDEERRKRKIETYAKSL